MHFREFMLRLSMSRKRVSIVRVFQFMRCMFLSGDFLDVKKLGSYKCNVPAAYCQEKNTKQIKLDVPAPAIPFVVTRGIQGIFLYWV
ncbi:hypothetical protein L1887_05813 [Cichorium endivia]|nr:hypothetical protein L1887_05813 [Cichorium endivia]